MRLSQTDRLIAILEQDLSGSDTSAVKAMLDGVRRANPDKTESELRLLKPYLPWGEQKEFVTPTCAEIYTLGIYYDIDRSFQRYDGMSGLKISLTPHDILTYYAYHGITDPPAILHNNIISLNIKHCNYINKQKA